MDKLIKFFPFLPEEKDSGKLVIALLFYLFVPGIAAGIIGFICGLTIILIPVAFIAGLAGTVYTVMGIVFAIMKYMGQSLEPKK
ncbi:MAG: hypothetical protein IJ408_03400 [Clostridia bacterium]|nr:hypothetical protein [Clostridia bacterium]